MEQYGRIYGQFLKNMEEKSGCNAIIRREQGKIYDDNNKIFRSRG